MRKRIALIAFLLVFLTVAAAVADWRVQPFDSIVTQDPLTLTPTYSWNDSCSKAVGAPTLFYSNEPESWNSTNWAGQDHVVLNEGELSAPRPLIAFHFFNMLGVAATLNFGIDPKSTATYGSLIGAVGTATAPPYVVGSRGTRGFLSKYVPIAGLPTATPHGGAEQNLSVGERSLAISISPKLIAQWPVPANETISGEFELPNLSQEAIFYVYACTAHCTSLYTTVAITDFKHQRGYFPGATYLVHYDYTPAYIPNGGSAFEIIGGGGCTPNLLGTDLLDATPGPNATLVGNYGVPVDIYGAAAFSSHSQRFGVNPRGGTPFVGAAWVASLINPQTVATVSPAAYVLPTAQPTPVSTPIPWPTSTVLTSNGQSALLGFDKGSGHTVIYILPGGNSAPVWMWDYVVTPVPALRNKRAEVHNGE